MRKRLTTQQKNRRSLIGGLAGLLVGFWMLFFTKTLLGFLPAILGAILLMWGRR